MAAASHPNVVPVQYACQTPDRIILAMQYFPGGSLRPMIADGPMPLHDVLRFVQAVLSGLTRIHQAGFIHFDLKPSNVLISDAGMPMIADSLTGSEIR